LSSALSVLLHVILSVTKGLSQSRGSDSSSKLETCSCTDGSETRPTCIDLQVQYRLALSRATVFRYIPSSTVGTNVACCGTCVAGVCLYHDEVLQLNPYGRWQADVYNKCRKNASARSTLEVCHLYMQAVLTCMCDCAGMYRCKAYQGFPVEEIDLQITFHCCRSSDGGITVIHAMVDSTSRVGVPGQESIYVNASSFSSQSSTEKKITSKDSTGVACLQKIFQQEGSFQLRLHVHHALTHPVNKSTSLKSQHQHDRRNG
jgi:hypothetical protein